MRLRLALVTTAAGLLCVTAGGCARGSGGSGALQAALEAPKPPAFVGKGAEAMRLWKDVQRFYKRRGFQPAWGRGTAPALVAETAKAAAEGLDPADYELGDSAALAEKRSSWNPVKHDKPDAEQEVQAELRLSYVAMKYASHLLIGRVDPRALDKQWVGETRRSELPELLEKALSPQGLRATFEGLRPKHPQYGLLRQALQKYRELAAHGGWPTTLPADATLKKGARGPAVGALRARLQATGDLSASRSNLFDDALAQGLAHFEARHGLEPDGVLDKDAVAALNVPVEKRIRQIELNLERWRWLPEELGTRYVMVNIPGFRLQAFDAGKPALEMRVVTGSTENPTPILRDEMTHVIFSPYWNIPPKIAREELVPQLQRNPNYLSQRGVEVVKGHQVLDPSVVDWNDEEIRLRQRPGERNALGLVKFAFPNRFNVYLHDTPDDDAFHRASRDLSHGCVRVEKPVELAQWVLRGQSEWTPERIQAAMHAGTEKHVKLAQPIPVYLAYQTAWVADDGTVLFTEDLYGHDAAQLGLMEDASV